MIVQAEPRMWLALGLGVAAAAGNLFGGLFVVYRSWPRRSLTYFLALGAGFMLAASLLEMVPESLHLLGDSAMLLIVAGYFLVHFFEHTLAPHFHFGEETHADEVRHRHASLSALGGLGIHSFFDGVAIASGFLISDWLGAVVFLAIILHKLPEGFTVSSLLLAGGRSRQSALLGAALLGAATVAGVILMTLLHTAVAYTLPLSAGVTLYVAASDLIPEVNREPGTRIAILVFLGAALVLLLQKLFHF